MAQYYWGDDYWGSQYWGAQYWAAGTFAGVYDQTLSVEGVFTLGGFQEHVPPDSPSGYYQTSRVEVLIVDVSTHEYIPSQSGAFGQTGLATLNFTANFTQTYLESDLQVADVSLAFSFGGAQTWYASGQEVDFLQVGTLSASFARPVLQDWEDPFYGPQAYCLMPSVNGITEQPTVFNLTIWPALVQAPEYFYLKFMCSAIPWVSDTGDAGAPVGVELLWGDNSRFVSLLPDHDYAIIEQHVEPSYTKLYDALIAGELQIKVRGFERFAGYSLSQAFESDSAIRLRAYY